MSDIFELVEEWEQAVAGMERALESGTDFESVFPGPVEELPEGIPLSFTIPHARLADMLPVAREKLAFWRDLMESLGQMARGEGVPARTREEEELHDW